MHSRDLNLQKKFKDLKIKLNSILNKDKYEKQIPLDKVLEMLWDNNKKQMLALNKLTNYYLAPVKNELKKRIEAWNDKFKPAFLYELLAEQKINIDIEINKKIYNPKNFSIFENSEVAQALLQIQKLAFKSPQIENLAISELHKYLLINFPNIELEGKKIGKIIFNIVKNMFENDYELSIEEKKIKEMLTLNE